MAVSVIPAKGAVDLSNAPYGTEGMAISVIPAKAGIQKGGCVNFDKPLDSHLRGNDGGVRCYMLVGFVRPRYTKSTAPKGGIQKCGYANFAKPLDSHLRGNDGGVHCYRLVGSVRPRYSKSTAPKGGIQRRGHVDRAKALDSRLRGNDGEGHFYRLVGSVRPRYSKSTAPLPRMTAPVAPRRRARPQSGRRSRQTVSTWAVLGNMSTAVICLMRQPPA